MLFSACSFLKERENTIMCGIIGYTGEFNGTERILAGLEVLEYRGYDSSGIAVQTNGELKQIKIPGRVSSLRKMLNQSPLPSTCGIGHTRWATHGAPTQQNAHPHGTDRVCLVHNGIIENYITLRKELQKDGYVFQSETDTEAAALLLDQAWEKWKDPLRAIREIQARLEGSYALAILFRDLPGEIYALRKDSPLLAAQEETGSFTASDLTAILTQTNQYFSLKEGEILRLRPEGLTFFNQDNRPISKQIQISTLTPAAAEKGGMEHFMLKEIYEQPLALRQTLSPRIQSGLPCFEEERLEDGFLEGIEQIKIVACGTAMHAGMIGKAVMESLARIPTTVDIASEFRYANPILTARDLVLVVSQSGETADTLAALRLANQQGVPTLAVVNTAGSAIAREAQRVIYTYAGPEIAVASTKAYSTQMAIFYLLALRLGLLRNTLHPTEAALLTAALQEQMPQSVEDSLALRPFCKRIAMGLKETQQLFYIGRGVDYALSLEGSLKMKEISYISSQACAAGELKHGTLALITPGVPVIATVTQNILTAKAISNIREVQARGGKIILLAPEKSPAETVCVDRLPIPDLPDWLRPFPAAVLFQLLAYETALVRGCDVDRPRNLAKSVTVE